MKSINKKRFTTEEHGDRRPEERRPENLTARIAKRRRKGRKEKRVLLAIFASPLRPLRLSCF
ncbi:MAG: hypothetical protein AVDCRST_MAG56-8147 [uncultured Cytophagales bacterium]|uniref:Uncharacterized protein n=1 Tax=uncultured Cytophagales bacterium TaxID=158755 RepID=A0A6J4M1J7_9SPHI|nr:MAG: hypothetical protein AVDCRST_MAG56-8147 [uncultured Cytophagales bacterium]